MRDMRSALMVSLLLTFVAACGGGATDPELLEEAAQPLVDGHDIVEDFLFMIDSGISRGAFLDEWPGVAAAARRSLSDFEDDLPDGVAEVDLLELEAYAEAIRNVLTGFDAAASATRDFIFNDGPESAMGDAMFSAQLDALLLDVAKDRALEPGEDDVETTVTIEETFTSIG